MYIDIWIDILFAVRERGRGRRAVEGEVGGAVAVGDIKDCPLVARADVYTNLFVLQLYSL